MTGFAEKSFCDIIIFKEQITICYFKEGKAVPQHKFITKQLISKGWSEDKKYCVTNEQGKNFCFVFLRLNSMTERKGNMNL